VETGEAFNHRFNAWSVKKKERPAWDPVCLPESALDVTKLYVLLLYKKVGYYTVDEG
jgi:hypothetical protein